MSYKIVVDSCGELPVGYKKDACFESVPLVLDIDGHHVVDDETFDQADFLRRVAESPNCPKVLLPLAGALSGGLYLRGQECVCGYAFCRT